MALIHPQKHVNFGRFGDKVQVIVRDSSFKKIFEREVSSRNVKELEILLKDLKNKGVDLIGVIKRRMIDGSGWFD